jgi:hypothetical protein
LHTEKKHNSSLTTEKHNLLSVKYARHITTIMTSIQCTPTSQILEVDYLLAQVKRLEQKVEKNKKKTEHKLQVCNNLLIVMCLIIFILDPQRREM